MRDLYWRMSWQVTVGRLGRCWIPLGALQPVAQAGNASHLLVMRGKDYPTLQLRSDRGDLLPLWLLAWGCSRPAPRSLACARPRAAQLHPNLTARWLCPWHRHSPSWKLAARAGLTQRRSIAMGRRTRSPQSRHVPAWSPGEKRAQHHQDPWAAPSAPASTPRELRPGKAEPRGTGRSRGLSGEVGAAALCRLCPCRAKAK